MLRAYGHQVSSAKDGGEGLECARAQKPDLILLDIHMPKMDGYEVLRRLRIDVECSSIPTIAVTALAMVGDREKLISSGFDGYISKPIDPATFVEKVQEFLNDSGLPPATTVERVSAPVAAAQPPKRRGVFLIVDNSVVNLQLVSSMLAPQGYEIITAISAEEGIDLARRYKPNLIVSDVHMPLHDGFYFVDLLKSDAELREIPFVFLSSSSPSLKDAEMAIVRGAKKLLNRPIDPQTLVSELEACLDAPLTHSQGGKADGLSSVERCKGTRAAGNDRSESCS